MVRPKVDTLAMAALLLLAIFSMAAPARAASLCLGERALHCVDATCGLHIDGYAPPDNPLPCTYADYHHEFTPCQSDGTRTAVFYWRPPATCRGGVSLPPPMTGVPCNLTCPEGTRLDEVSRASCVACGAGSYSTGGGVLFEEPWDTLPAQFTTECVAQVGNCSSWRASGDYLESGDNLEAMSLQSILMLQFDLVRPGTISFEYRIHAEAYYDYLIFSIDGPTKLFANTQMDDFARVSYAVDAGHHLVRWWYLKDSIISGGEDKVYLRSIEVVGLSYADVECPACEAGRYAPDDGMGDCLECPPGRFQDETGKTACKDCEAWEKSFAGAAECQPDVPCGSLDWGVHRSACTGGEQVVTYAWLEPIECDFDNATALPNATTAACTSHDCPPGTEDVAGRAGGGSLELVDGAGGDCAYCLPGTANAMTNAACRACAAGHQAVNAVRYYSLWEDAGAWTTSCEGDCGTPGWRWGGDFADSGAGHGRYTNVALTLGVTVKLGARVRFRYVLACHTEAAELVVYAGSAAVAVFPCPGTCSSEIKEAGVELPAAAFGADGTLTALRWVYSKDSPEGLAAGTGGCDLARIYDVSVENVRSDVGASACTPCPPGSFAAAAGDPCQPCAPGTFAADHGATGCDPCPAGAVAFQVGASECLACGDGTVASADATTCDFDCRLEVEGRTYDLGPLRDRVGVVGPVPSRFNDSVGVYLDLCGKLPASHRCGSLLSAGWTTSDGRHAGGLTGGAPMYTLPSYACAVRDDGSMATSLGVIPNADPQPDHTPGLRLAFLAGSGECEGEPARRREAVVSLVCDETAGFGDPVDVGSASLVGSGDLGSGACVAEFEWRSAFACPLCTAADYGSVVGSCTGEGHQTEEFFLLPSARCTGGQAAPAAVTTDCEPAQVVDVKDYVMSPGAVVVVVVVSLLVIGGVAGVVARNYRRNRALYSQYQSLAATGGTSLGNLSAEDSAELPAPFSPSLSDDGGAGDRDIIDGR